LFSRSLTPQIILPDNPGHEKRILETLNDHIRENRNNPDSKIKFALGVSSLLPKEQKAKLKEIANIRYLLASNAKYKKFLKGNERKLYNDFYRLTNVKEAITVKNLPPEILRNLKGIGKHDDKRVILLFTKFDSTKGELVGEYVKELDTIRVDGRPLEIAADVLVMAEVFRLIESDGYILLYLVFSGVLLFVYLNFGSVRKTSLVFFPLAIGIAIMSGAMGLFGVPTDYFNVIMIPVVVGIGIDSGIHIFHRYQETGSVMTAIHSSGEAVSLSTLTSLVGFGALSLGRNAGLASMGMVAVIGLSSVYLMSVFLLPALILITEKRNAK